jgi:acyl-coenzyme A thioesterase PaaI-like protein
MARQKQASATQCFVCGVENPLGLHLQFYQVAPGEVTAEFTPLESYQGYPGVLHGGIAAAALDETAGRALMGIFPPRFMFTARLEVKYRKNIPLGQSLSLVGRVVRDRGRLAESWAGLYQGEELLAEAKVLLADMPDPPDPSTLESAGWKVYPEL